MSRKIAVIGVGNMARSIVSGILSSSLSVKQFFLYDKNTAAYECFASKSNIAITESLENAVKEADCVLLSVKPQNYTEVLEKISTVNGHEKKLYISIAAGITSESVSNALDGAVVIRVLPNLPMTVGYGVSAICKNEYASKDDFDFVNAIFACAGSTTIIDEAEMNRIIGVTSSSPAYVFKFIDAICKGASAQGLDGYALLGVVCDMVIGSAMLLKGASDTPSQLISKVASKGGTTEQALIKLDDGGFEKIIENAMIACTARADELGKQ